MKMECLLRAKSRYMLKLLFFTTVASIFVLPVIPAHADPPVTQPGPPAIPPFIPPPVFCFRLTDIADVVGDPEGNAFTFEFEVLNWTDQPAFGLDLMKALAINPPTFAGTPIIVGAGIDPNGRTIGGGNDDANFSGGPAPDGTLMPVKIGAANGWLTGAVSPTTANFFDLGPGLPNRDLLGVPPGSGPARTAAALALVPSDGAAPNFVDVFGRPVIGNFEAIDNGGLAVDGLPDNVLDGFTITVDDFDPGEQLSLNWFLNDALGVPIGTVNGGNAYGFGNFNLYRSALPVPGDVLPPLWQRQPGSPFGEGQNRGEIVPPVPTAAQFTSVSNITGTLFALEPGAALTAPYENPADACPGCDVNADPLPPDQLAPPGLSVFDTIPGQTMIQGIPGTTNPVLFGGLPGPGPVPECPDCNMVIDRLALLDPLGAPIQTVPIQLVQLDLVSVQPIDIGFGPEFLFLQAGGPLPGQLTVDFQRNTFNMQLPMQFDIFGETSGFLLNDTVTMQIQGGQFNSSDPFKISLPGVNEGLLPLQFSLQGLSAGLGLNFLHTLGIPLFDPADKNMDGFVDSLDLGLLLAQFGTAVPFGDPCDLNNDGFIDGLDLGLMLAAWNPPPLASAAAVPEPTSLMLFGLGLVALGYKRRVRK